MAHYCSNCATALEFERNLPVGSSLVGVAAAPAADCVPVCSLCAQLFTRRPQRCKADLGEQVCRCCKSYWY